MKSLSKQIDGNHYAKYKIQPMEFAMQVNLNPLQFSILKYTTRYLDKNGIKDLQKALHCTEILIEYQANTSNYVGLSQVPFMHGFQKYCDDNNLNKYQCLIIQSLAFNELNNCSNYIYDLLDELSR